MRDGMREEHHQQPPPPLPVNLTVTLPPNSVMMPSWLVFCLVGAFVLSSFALVVIWNTNKQLTAEIRVLQLYVGDIQNVLIRQGVATRSDFVMTPGAAVKNIKEEKEKGK